MSDTNGSVVSFPSGGSVQQHQPYNEQPEIRLPRRISPVVIAACALPFLFWLATIAFTPAGVQRFTVGLGRHVGWLIGSPDGNRVATFAMFGLGIVATIGVFRAAIIRNYGLGAFGSMEFLLGTAMGAGAIMEWHLGQIGLLLAGGIVWGAYILLVFGWRNLQNDQGPTHVPQFQAQALPEQTIYGAARTAFDDEIHEALRDRVPPANPGYRYKE